MTAFADHKGFVPCQQSEPDMSHAGRAAAGFVYVLTNDSMPGMVKIGRTTRSVDLRAAELWQTGVPTRFEVYAIERTCDCAQLEAYVHRDLRKHRVNKAREFFAVAPEFARVRARFWAELQAEDLIRAHFDGIAAVPFRTLVDSVSVERLAEETGQEDRLVAEAMADLTVNEIGPAIHRTIARKAEEHRAFLAEIGLADEGAE